MIKAYYYSDLTKQTYDDSDEADIAEFHWAAETLHDTSNHIAKDFFGEDVLAIDCNEISSDAHLFVPLTEDAVKAFKILIDAECGTIENEDEFKVRTPIKWNEDASSWKLLPNLVKYAHRIYTELSDEMAKIENDINEKMGEG